MRERKTKTRKRGVSTHTTEPRTGQESTTPFLTRNQQLAAEKYAFRVLSGPVEAALSLENPDTNSERKRRREEEDPGATDDDVSGPPNRPRARDPIQLPFDERLMELVASNGANFADPDKPINPLWDSIGLALGQSNGGMLQQRVQFLRDVSQDPSHEMHSSLTLKLKILLKFYVDARRRRNNAILNGLRRSVREAASGATLAAQEESGIYAGKPLPCLEKGRVAVDIDVELEEEVARIVLRHSPRFPEAQSVARVWQAIANDSRGRYTSRVVAQQRTLWLCKVASKPSHSKHSQLRPALRDMLLQIASHLHTETGVERGNQGKKSGGRSATKMTVDSKNDELLMSLVLEKRLFVHDLADRNAAWDEIVAATRHPRVRDRASCILRVIFLNRVFEKPSHDQHSLLTAKLRFLLTKYALAPAHRRETERRHDDHDTSHRTQDDQQTEATTSNQRDDVPEERVDETVPSDIVISYKNPKEATPEAVATTQEFVHPSEQEESPQENEVASLTGKIASLEKKQEELRGELRTTQETLHKLHGDFGVQRAAYERETTAMRQLLEKERRDRREEFKSLLGLFSRVQTSHGTITADTASTKTPRQCNEI